MPTGQIITLGIGTPSDIPILVLTGLSIASAPPPPVSGAGVLPIGPKSILAADVIYTLPVRAVNVEWLSTIATDLEVSIDQTNWITIDSSAGAGTRFVSNIAALFIRATEDVTVILKRFRDKL